MFDKPAYTATDVVRVRVAITNAGDRAASGVLGSGGGDLDVWGAWGELGREPGVRIEPHATRVTELAGRILNASDGSVTFQAGVKADGGDATPGDNSVRLDVPVIMATGAFAGMIFGDTNANGAVDAGETGLPGVRIDISGGVPFGNHTQTTDAAGRFDFGAIPTGEYHVFYTDAPGWFVYGFTGSNSERITIDDSGRYAGVTIPATRHLSESLRVNMRFSRDTYQAGETTELTVVLTNHGSAALTGITARCVQSPPDLRGGAGWGALAEGGPGVTVPAGQSRLVMLSEPVPEASPRYGHVSAHCGFLVTGYPERVGVRAEDTASVPGGAGNGRGRIILQPSLSEPGQPLPGATVVITDQNTGAVVAQEVTDGEGRFAVHDVPAGVYDLRVAGPYKPPGFPGGGWYSFAVFQDDPGFEPTYTVLPDSVRDNSPPNLKVSAEFDKAAYETDDEIRVRIRIENIGQAAAEHVHVIHDFSGPTFFPHPDMWGEFNFSAPGARIEPGEVRTLEVSGFVFSADSGLVTFGATFAGDNGDLNQSNNRFSLAAPLTRTFGDFTGVLFGDEDNDGVFDQGEELPGAQVFLSGPGGVRTDLTGPDGRFSFTEVLTGRYALRFSAPGWIVTDNENLVIHETNEEALVRAFRPLADRLRVSMTFLQESYRVGDLAQVRVVLTNAGPNPVEHVRAECFGGMEGLPGTGEGWGPLRRDAEGVRVAPGETRTIDVSETVPAEADAVGFVSVFCEFRTEPDQSLGTPSAGDTANIAGRTGTARGRLVRDVEGDNFFDDPVPSTKVVLIHPRTGAPVAKTVTDADGNFDIAGLPARDYEVRVVGPWQPVEFEFMRITVFAGDSDRRWFRLVPGPEQPDPFPDPTPATPAPAPQPQPQAAVAPVGLASTGANVADLVMVCVGLLLAGSAAVAATRRRKARQG